MKNLILSIVFLMSASAAVAGDIQFTDATLKCFDGQTEIGIYDLTESEHLETGDVITLQDLARQNIIVKVRHEDQVYTFTNNTVAVDDGAGNVRYQTFALNLGGSGSQEMNIEKIMSLDYDHETGYLTGNYAIEVPVTESGYTYNVHRLINLEDESMNCYDYTYGDKE